jgi:hypothetical protein
MSASSLSSIVSQPLSPTSTASTNLKTDFWKQFLRERGPEVQQLNQALKSGDLTAAQQAYNSLVTLAKTELHQDNPFLRSDRAQDFNAIGAALQNGDLTGAQQALAALRNSFRPSPHLTTPTASASLSNYHGVESGSSNGVSVVA